MRAPFGKDCAGRLPLDLPPLGQIRFHSGLNRPRRKQPPDPVDNLISVVGIPCTASARADWKAHSTRLLESGRRSRRESKCFLPGDVGSLTEMLLERYTAYNAAGGHRRFFRV